MAQPETSNLSNQTNGKEEEEWEDEESENDSDDEGDDDINAEAEEIARRLGEELWAISKANTVQTSTTDTVPSNATSPEQVHSSPIVTNPATSSRKGEAAIITIKAILAVVENDSPARHALASTIVPNSNGDNVLDILRRLMTSGVVSKAIAISLGPVLVALARSDALFGNLRHSNAPSIQLDKGKRKREETDDSQNSLDLRTVKRPYVPESDLQLQINEAVRIIAQALESSPSRPLDPTLVSSIRLQLHQVFLFAVTSSAGGGQDMHALQEISGLIQVIGVLSGIQIGQPPEPRVQAVPYPTNPAFPWIPPPTAASATDIGTAVYPCLIACCKKTFSRLYTLRAHQRVHAVHRPYRCTLCPASFARNHDLKRHIKLHDNKAWKCGGCLKIFSRRDAIKRHKTGSKTRGPRSEACISAEVLEVELDEDEGEESIREERRAKLWSGIATSQADAAAAAQSIHGFPDSSHVEEGEILPTIISAVQQTVLSLHGLLQAHVGGALGTPTGPSISPPMDPAAGQATLASVIARAQLLNMPQKITTTETVDAACNALGGITDPTSLLIGVNTEATVSHDEVPPASVPPFSMYGLSDEQTRLLEEAITNAAFAAQAQAEAEAALEEEDDDDSDDSGDGE
ncbi:hypothetical protein H2248_004885 [Termitomyces sp. 'cryptogamus']|nr:hypothetical protein H2248_004885 [Termitomyces sp. 'cryptogamus']